MEPSPRLSDIWSYSFKALYDVAQSHGWKAYDPVENFRRYEAPKLCQTSIKYFEDSVIISTPHLRIGFWQRPDQENIKICLMDYDDHTEKELEGNFGNINSLICDKEKNIIITLIQAGFNAKHPSSKALKHLIYT